MRITSSVLSAILAIATIAGTATAKQPTVVYPTGIFPADVQNVQAAIDQGGTILLKATDPVGHPLAFNFGAPAPFLGSGVNIATNVSITGESVGGTSTTISGGDRPFVIFGGKNSVSGLKFDGPFKGPILILGSTGTSIVGNEIQNVVPAQFNGFTLTDGIDVTAPNPANISGNLVISGNTIRDLTGTSAIGIQVDSVAANVTIANNIFQLGQLPGDLGFNQSAGIACLRCHSVVAISGNVITIGSGVVFDGIIIYGDSDARYHVFDNTINCQGPWPDGIDVFGQTGGQGQTVSAIIEHNTITVHNGFFAGIALGGAVNNCTIQGNTVTGDAGAAFIGTSLFSNGDMVSSNRFLNNDIAGVETSIASIFFDTNTAKNIVRGQCVSVVDLGTGNDVSCPNAHSNVNSTAFNARQQMIGHALEAQSAVRAQWNDLNRP